MKHKSIRTTLLISYVVLLIIALGLDYMILKRLGTTLSFNKTVRGVVDFNLKYRNFVENQYSFFINYSKDPIFFRTEQSDYIRRQQLLYNELRNDIQSFFENPIFNQSQIEKISQIKSQIDVINSYFTDIKHKLYLRGNLNLKSGYIGKVQEYYISLKANSPNKALASEIDRLYGDFLSYLSSGDEFYYKQFLSDFTKVNKILQGNERDSAVLDTTVRFRSLSYSNKFLTALNEFKNYFRDLVQLDGEIGLLGSKGLINAWTESVYSTNTIFQTIKKELFHETYIYLKHYLSIYLILSTFTIIILVLVLIFDSKIFEYSYKQIYNFVEPLRYGDIPKKISIKTHNEIGTIIEIMNIYIDSLQKKVRFAQEIGQGRYDIDFSPLSEKDVLGNALLQLREDLKKAQVEEEKRKEEERIRQWTNEGISKFSEILRQHSQDISSLAKVTIKNLVNYLNANQGAFFILEEIEDGESREIERYLELIATYAYNKERKKKKRFLLGEGLVGTVALEQETTYMTDIPEDYVSITSGLGSANPRSLLIVPLKHEDMIVGVIEIASFNLMKEYEIKFVEQVAESIAATLSLTKINERNQRLLQQFQFQAREMASKEEEMRQNLEELRATQEEAARREAQLQSLINAIETAGFVIVLDINGFISRVNERLLEHLGVSHYDIVGHHISDFDIEGGLAKDELLEIVKNGDTIHYLRHFVLNGKEYWFDEYYAPMKDSRGNIVQIIVIASDITENVMRAKELENKAKDLEEEELKLKLEMAEIEEARNQLEKQRDKAQARLRELENKQQELNKALEMAHEREKASQEMLRKLNIERRELKSMMEDFLANKEILEYLHKHLEEKEKQLKTRLYEATRQITKKDKVIDELKDKVKYLEEEIKKFKNRRGD